MRRDLAFVALLLLLIPLEAAIPVLPHLHDVRPLLHIPAILFFAMRLGTIEGAVLSSIAGLIVGVTVPYPPGLAEFTDVALFVLARLLLGGVRAEGPILEAFMAAVLVALFHLITWATRSVFGVKMTSLAGTPWLHEHLISCGITAAVTPFIFAIARRIERFSAKTPGVFS